MLDDGLEAELRERPGEFRPDLDVVPLLEDRGHVSRGDRLPGLPSVARDGQLPVPFERGLQLA